MNTGFEKGSAPPAQGSRFNLILETQHFVSKIEPETHPRSLGPKEACGCPRKTGSQADLRVMVARALFKALVSYKKRDASMALQTPPFP